MNERVIVMVYRSSAYGRGIIRGIARYVRTRAHWAVSVDDSWELHAEAVLKIPGEGIIAQIGMPALVEAIRATGLPAVNVADFLEDVPFPSVYSDGLAIGRKAAEQFLDAGFAHFAYFGLAETLFSHRRGEGFARAVEEAGFECVRAAASLELPARELDTDAVSAWLRSLPRPVGLMACNDSRARTLVDVCLRIGLRVPEEVAIIGVDDDETFCELAAVPLSSVAPDTERIGYEAASLLSNMLAGQDPPAEPILIQPLRVVARQSSNAQPIQDPQVARAVRFVAAHAGEPITVEDVVAELDLSRRSLERRFRRVLKRSPSAEIRRARLERARRLLVETDLPMPKVAAASGFSDAPNFTRAFGRDVGMTPTDYRNQYRIT